MSFLVNCFNSFIFYVLSIMLFKFALMKEQYISLKTNKNIISTHKIQAESFRNQILGSDLRTLKDYHFNKLFFSSNIFYGFKSLLKRK